MMKLLVVLAAVAFLGVVVKEEEQYWYAAAVFSAVTADSQQPGFATLGEQEQQYVTPVLPFF